MKNKMFIGFLLAVNLLLASCKGNDHKTEAAATPVAVINAFKAKYGDVNDVKWEQVQKGDKTIFDAEFKSNGKKVEAEFDDTGTFIDEK